MRGWEWEDGTGRMGVGGQEREHGNGSMSWEHRSGMVGGGGGGGGGEGGGGGGGGVD